MNRLAAFAIAVFGALVCAGCGNNNGLYPVSGKVLCNGAPAAGATVTFLRKEVERRAESALQGVVQDDGSFALAGPKGSGAAPGEYIVLVEWKEGAGKTKGRAPALAAPDRLKGRYLDPQKPLLTATVEPATNNLPPFEVQ
jgi:hypothetical protein